MDVGGNIAATGVVIFLVSMVFGVIFNKAPRHVFMANTCALLILGSLIVIAAGTIIKIWTQG